MQFSLTSVVLALTSVAAALPHESVGNGMQSQEHDAVRWHVPSGMTVQEAQSKCGDQAQLSCCNKATYAGDTTDVNSGLGGGLLSNLIGSGSGADGAGIFDQCSKLDLQSKLYPNVLAILLMLTLSQSLSSLPSPSRTWSTSAASRTSLAVPARAPRLATTWSVPAFPALPSARSSKRFALGPLFSGGWKFRASCDIPSCLAFSVSVS